MQPARDYAYLLHWEVSISHGALDMNSKLRIRHAMIASALSLALGAPLAQAAGDTSTQTNGANTQGSMTGKQKATAIGAGTGAVAGAVVGGPVGALVGAGIGGYVGHEGTDANGRVSTSSSRTDAELMRL